MEAHTRATVDAQAMADLRDLHWLASDNLGQRQQAVSVVIRRFEASHAKQADMESRLSALNASVVQVTERLTTSHEKEGTHRRAREVRDMDLDAERMRREQDRADKAQEWRQNELGMWSLLGRWGAKAVLYLAIAAIAASTGIDAVEIITSGGV